MTVRTVPLKEVCTVIMGQAPKGASYNSEENGLPLLAGARDLGEIEPNPTRFTSEPTRIAEAGDIILCVRATLGKTNWARRTYCLGRGVASLRANPQHLDSAYLWHWIATQGPKLEQQARGSTFRQVTRDVVQGLKISLPPLPEQRRIAAILDKADAVRRKRQQTLDLADQFLRSAFLNMFGDPVTNPKGWPTCRLEKLVREGDRINYGVVQPGPYVEGGVPIVRVGDFHRGGIEKTGVKRISQDIEASYVRSRLRGNEILVSCVGSIGQIAIAEAEMRGWNIVRAVARASLSDFVDTAYIAEYLRTPYVQSYFRSETRTVSQPTLNIKQIRNAPIRLPPIEEQRSFGRLVCEFSALLVHLSAAQALAGNLRASLVQQVF
ncbi:restriction endonuclease subunit S [bacterium]|nr:restriction endonuclease subunit S [bacterium]